MKISPEELNRRMDQCKEALKNSGIKLTHQRMEIFREVAESNEHPDAETIFKSVRERIPMVSLDTVYRTLWLLIDLGLVTTLGPARDRTRFDANMNSHHHFVCTRCGMTRDFYSPDFDSLTVPDCVNEMGRVEKAHVEVRGVCFHCLEKRGSTKE